MKINIDQILVIPTKSRYELEVERSGKEKAREKFGVNGVWENICEGHKAQKENLEKVSKVINSKKIVYRELLTEEKIKDNEVFFFLGGDNHFTYCSQIILKYLKKNPDEKKYIAGVVLDSSKSLGALLNFGFEDFIELIKNPGKLGLEKWTVLESKVSTGEVSPAIGDYFIGEKERVFMSRNKAYLDEKELLLDKSAGILVVTGSGSDKGSWYNNVHNTYYGESGVFGREEEIASIILTENESKTKIQLKKGQTLIIDSYNDDEGIIAPDSHLEHSADFSIGARVEIKISDLKLNVLKPTK
jgi:hypothetical protein